MNTPKDGGPAFPLHIHGDHGQGMTLRDWFAGQALTGYLANPSIEMYPQDTAEWAYKHADAMLAARERKEPSK